MSTTANQRGNIETTGTTITVDSGGTPKVITPGGAITTAGDFITSGAYSQTLIASATTSLTLPPGTGDVLVARTSTDTLTNKTLTSPNINEAVALTTTATKLNYLTSATGTTGTASTKLVFSTSPTLITPALGTPSALVGTNITGTAASFTAGSVTTNANLTGDVTSSGNTTSYAGTLGVSLGGTGQTSATAGADALLPMTTGGDLMYGGLSGTVTRLANGSAGEVLTSGGTTAAPTWTATLTNPMDSDGDLIVGGSSGAAIKLAAGTTSQVLIGGTSPSFGTVTSAMITDDTIVNADINTSAAISGSKIVPASASVPGVVSIEAQAFTGTKTFVAPVLGEAVATSINLGDTTLAAFKEGTWTPVATIGGTGLSSSATGYYQRTGSWVHAQCTVSNMVVDGNTGAFTVTGLPYAATIETPGTLRVRSITFATTDIIVATVGSSSTTFSFVKMQTGSNGAAVDEGDLHATLGDVYIQIGYRTADAV